MTIAKYVSSLLISICIPFTCYAIQYECPQPSQIKVLPLIPGGVTPLPGLALWFAPAMSTSIGGATGFGVSDGIDHSVGPFVGSGARTIIVNGHPVPGYYCTYLAKTSMRSSDIQRQIELLPLQHRSNAQKLISQGSSMTIGTLDYFLRSS